MRVLVTGGAGFIGSHIVDALLAQGHEPFVIDNLESGRRENLPADVPLYVVDIRDDAKLKSVFDEVKPQWVSHQAAQMSVTRSVREPVFDAQVNAVGLLQVFDHAARVGAERVTFASSGGVLYGDVLEPADEDAPCGPISPYGINKWVGEKYLEFYVNEYGVKGVALRYSNVYGPRQNPHGEAGVVAIFSQRMLAGQQSTIFGDGKNIRDYVFVNDVARANLLALQSDVTQDFVAFNVGTSVGTDVNELAELLRACCQEQWGQTGRSGEVPAAQHGEARSGELRSSLLLARRAKELFGWEPKVQLEEGLRQTVEWFAQQAASADSQ